MSVFFKISSVDLNNFQFHLLNADGDALLIGAEFEDIDAAEKAIQEVRVGSLMSQQIAKGKTKQGDMFFVIKNQQGDIIAKSNLYNNEMMFDNALHNVKENACVAKISLD